MEQANPETAEIPDAEEYASQRAAYRLKKKDTER
jgi:hypothetical protein